MKKFYSTMCEHLVKGIDVKTAIRKMGNSQGILIPKPFLMQTGLDIGEVDIQVQDDTIVIRKPRGVVRQGWAKACQKIAAANADQPIAWPLIAKDQDADIAW